ncbi:MAG: hypothetical protein R3E11_05690 [Sphingobium sp.]
MLIEQKHGLFDPDVIGFPSLLAMLQTLLHYPEVTGCRVGTPCLCIFLTMVFRTEMRCPAQQDQSARPLSPFGDVEGRIPLSFILMLGISGKISHQIAGPWRIPYRHSGFRFFNPSPYFDTLLLAAHAGIAGRIIGVLSSIFRRQLFQGWSPQQLDDALFLNGGAMGGIVLAYLGSDGLQRRTDASWSRRISGTGSKFPVPRQSGNSSMH